jgi:hypothetical protein
MSELREHLLSVHQQASFHARDLLAALRNDFQLFCQTCFGLCHAGNIVPIDHVVNENLLFPLASVVWARSSVVVASDNIVHQLMVHPYHGHVNGVNDLIHWTIICSSTVWDYFIYGSSDSNLNIYKT